MQFATRISVSRRTADSTYIVPSCPLRTDRPVSAFTRLVARTALLSSLLGIKGVHTDPDGGLKIVYDLDGGRSATLAIHTQAGQGRFKGASVSSIIPRSDKG